MDNGIYIDLTNQAVKMALMISAPMLAGALIIGILVSLFQAVTQINEQTLSFIPKIVVIAVAMVICAPWMSDVLTTFTHELIVNIPNIIAGK